MCHKTTTKNWKLRSKPFIIGVLRAGNNQNYQTKMATTSDIKNGMCLELDGDTYIIVQFQHVKPGKGNAFVRTKLKSLTSGKVIDNTFPAGHKINDVVVERRNFQFMYSDDDYFHFMNNETFEQVSLNKDMVDNSQFLKEGGAADILFHAIKEIPLACMLPQHVILQITYMEPGIKGDTASNTLTPATVETGATVRVPLFLKEGDYIKIDTATGDYLGRVNNMDK